MKNSNLKNIKRKGVIGQESFKCDKSDNGNIAIRDKKSSTFPL